MTRRRTLTPEERGLWRSVTKTVAPISKPALEHDAGDVGAAPPARSGSGDSARAQGTSPRHDGASRPRRHNGPPDPMAAGDPALDRRAARGRLAIDATLDLHGMNQAGAHAALIHFIHRGRAQGHRCLLIVTGKGRGKEGGGVLRARFGVWIADPKIRQHISRVAPAHQRHGGAGAFYIFLKGARKNPAR